MDKNRTSSAKWHDNATKQISSSRMCRCNAGLLPGSANNSNKRFLELSDLYSPFV